MKMLVYKGLLVTQNEKNHHVMIARHGELIFHSQCKKPMSDDELREIADNALFMQNHFDELWEGAKTAKTNKN